MKKLVAGLTTLAILGAPVVLASTAEAAPKPREYQNCTALNKAYPHGVGTQERPGQDVGHPGAQLRQVARAVYKLEHDERPRPRRHRLREGLTFHRLTGSGADQSDGQRHDARPHCPDQRSRLAMMSARRCEVSRSGAPRSIDAVQSGAGRPRWP